MRVTAATAWLITWTAAAPSLAMETGTSAPDSAESVRADLEPSTLQLSRTPPPTPPLAIRRWSALEMTLQLSTATGRRPSLVTPQLGLGLSRTTRPATPLERLAYSADKGAFAGLALGTLGEWGGLWDEKTGWALMGAGAALGAMWGGIGNKDVRISIAPGVGSTRSSLPELDE